MAFLIRAKAEIQSTAEVELGGDVQLAGKGIGWLSDGSTTVELPIRFYSRSNAIAHVTDSGLVTATEATYDRPYHKTGGRVEIYCDCIRPDGSTIGAPASCLVTVLGTKARESSIFHRQDGAHLA